MRATIFIILSLLIHTVCAFTLVFAPSVALTPVNTIEVSDSTLDVQIGEPDEQAGIETEESDLYTKPEEIKAPAPKPVVTVEKKVESAPEPVEPEKEVETTEAATVESTELTDDQTEASNEDLLSTNTDPTPEIESTVIATSSTHQPTGELGQGGATQEGAVSVVSLKQAAGNKPPIYPIQARLEGRQGQMEAVYRVTTAGTVSDIKVVQSTGSQDLDNEAVKAISQFKFVPGQEGWARHPVTFSLKGEATPMPSKLRSKGAQAD